MISEAKLGQFINKGFNILFSGNHGVGKTQVVRKVVQDMGLTLDYHSCGTMDPFIDFVGIPRITDDNQMAMVRPQRTSQADVLFFDELNRAEPKVQNGVFEIVQFRSLNGEPMNVKCVIAAINPIDEEGTYHVNKLDPALEDRFDIFIDVPDKPDEKYLANALGSEPIAKALVGFWEKTSKKDNYISPRRLEKIGRIYMETKNPTAVALSLPFDISAPKNTIYTLLRNAERGVAASSPLPKAKSNQSHVLTDKAKLRSEINKKLSNHQDLVNLLKTAPPKTIESIGKINPGWTSKVRTDLFVGWQVANIASSPLAKEISDPSVEAFLKIIKPKIYTTHTPIFTELGI